MKFKCLSFFTILLLLHTNAFANIFIVSSNGNSGPGTLREALSQAQLNGTSEADTIKFQITYTDTASVTITISSPLILSSNLLIDGTTNPWVSFGVSNAKIIIQSSSPTICLTGFIGSNCSNIQIYGLWLRKFRGYSLSCSGSAIALNNVSNITIGKFQAGNVFTENLIGVSHFLNSILGDSLTQAENIKIMSNFFGLHPDGNTALPEGGVSLPNGKNVTIGGSLLPDGNYFTNGAASVTSNRSIGNGFVRITGNTVGMNYQRNQAIGNSAILNVSGTQFGNKRSDFEVTISYNKLIHLYNAISVWYVNNNITIEFNEIGLFSGLPTNDNSFGIGILHVTRKDFILVMNNKVYGFQSGIYLSGTYNVTMLANDAECNIRGIAYYQPTTPPPIVRITDIGADYVRGKSPPLALINLFTNTQCLQYCENGLFRGSTTADNNGDWYFPFAVAPVVTATATNTNGYTSEFNSVKAVTYTAIVKNATCGQNNGSITGIQILNAASWHWENDLGQIISTDTNVYNLGPGRYRLVLSEANVACQLITNYFDIIALPRPLLTGSPFAMTNPSCGFANGKIKFTGVRPAGSINVWLDNANNNIAGNIDSISNLPSGQYFFKLYLAEDTTCNSLYGPFILNNISGPSLNTTNMQITPATCFNSNGSIINITTANTTGTLFIQWLDSLNNPAGNSLNLLNVPAGKYKLKFKDQSACDTIITPFYFIPASGRITIDTSSKMISPAGCTVNNGSIRNITVTGATTLQWINVSTNTVVGNTLDIYNLTAGNYKLTATNPAGCSATVTQNVPQAIFLPIGVTGVQSRNAVCGENNGHITIISFNNNPALYSFKWIDSTSGNIVSAGTSAVNLGAGTYFTLATDTNGCENRILRTVIGAFPKPVFDYSQMKVSNDACSMEKGSITGITLTGIYGPTTYRWINSTNDTVGIFIDLQNAGAGQYRLIVTDAGICRTESNWITIGNNNSLNPSLYDGVTIPKNTTALLLIKNFEPAEYLLYSAPSSIGPSHQNNTGNFFIGPVANDTIVYIKKVKGSCSSPFTAVKIKVVDSSYFVIPTGFTPNNDGLNDRLHVRVIGYIELEYFKIFNRSGQEIFSTKKIGDGWDGKHKGVIQPSSVFVWMAKGRDIKGKIITSKGTFVLISN